MHVLVEVHAGDDPHAVDTITDRLWVAGAVGVEEQPGVVIGAFEDAATAEAAATALDGSLRPVEDTTGLDAWRSHAEAITAGPFTVRVPWLDPGPGIDLVIDPGHTFGSGSHPSTRLALTVLAELIEPGMHVLDLGSGSGVLAIAAARLGASVTAVDLDPGSPATIAANAERNGVADRIESITADIASVSATADLTMLNVTIDIHETVAPGLRGQSLGPLLVAGILAGPQEQRAAAAHGRVIVDRLTEDEWAVVVLDHGPAPAPS